MTVIAIVEECAAGPRERCFNIKNRGGFCSGVMMRWILVRIKSKMLN